MMASALSQSRPRSLDIRHNPEVLCLLLVGHHLSQHFHHLHPQRILFLYDYHQIHFLLHLLLALRSKHQDHQKVHQQRLNLFLQSRLALELAHLGSECLPARTRQPHPP